MRQENEKTCQIRKTFLLCVALKKNRHLLGGWVILDVSHTKGSTRDCRFTTDTSHNLTEEWRASFTVKQHHFMTATWYVFVQVRTIWWNKVKMLLPFSLCAHLLAVLKSTCLLSFKSHLFPKEIITACKKNQQRFVSFCCLEFKASNMSWVSGTYFLFFFVPVNVLFQFVHCGEWFKVRDIVNKNITLEKIKVRFITIVSVCLHFPKLSASRQLTSAKLR